MRPLQYLCLLSVDGSIRSGAQLAVAHAARQLAHAAPLVLLLAFGDEPQTPLEAAAKNADFADQLVPVPRQARTPSLASVRS